MQPQAPSVDEQTQRAHSQPWVAGRGQTPTVHVFVGLRLSSRSVITPAFFMSSTLFIGPSLARLLLHIRMGSRCVAGHVRLLFTKQLCLVRGVITETNPRFSCTDICVWGRD